ncbi:MAG: glucose-1-phosphate adenylyltransferase [Acidobacteriota bacterium]|nr:glucose-1-phosphate adenylyltransferase [Acidobacteriota bacterium]
MNRRVLAMVLAGGKGTRLYPLTSNRAKPAVPFGGKYRIVDFVLSNLVNSGVYSTYVLTQFKSQSLLQHLRDTWQFGGLLPYQFIVPVPAQMRSPDEAWYQGTADAIFQNIDLIQQAQPDLVLVFSADHIYRMNVREMVEFHNEKEADITVAAVSMPKEQSSEFGVIETNSESRIIGFHEKNPAAPTIPGQPDRILASMGNYVFSMETLLSELYTDAKNENSSHDFGKDILPGVMRRANVFAYDFMENHIPGDPPEVLPYWRDVGTIDAFYEANMDLRSVTPALNLYNTQWPLGPTREMYPPAKFVFDLDGRRGHAIDSIVSGGCIISGGFVRDSVLGRSVRVHSGAFVEKAVLFDNCDIGRNARVRNAILDKNAKIPEGASIGYNPEEDRKRYYVSDNGVIVVTGHSSAVEVTVLNLGPPFERRREVKHDFPLFDKLIP